MTMTTLPCRVTAGVDTHLDVHVVAALDERGAVLGVESFETSARGYRRALRWLRRFGDVELAGVEGTGSYGAGLTRHLLAEGVAVVEVDRPNRQRRRKRGKSDPQDAIAAARAAQSGDALGAAKTRDGNVESMRVVRVARASARKARTQALNQMRSIISTAPEAIRAELRHLNVYRLIERASAYRPGKTNDLEAVTKRTLRMLARRAAALEEEVKEIDEALEALVSETAPALVARTGVGTDTASALLVAAGDNPGRLRSEATFAHLCGASPIDASSGKQQRHRLNRGGDRQANSALWKIVITRMVCDPPTRAYIERRVKDGLTKKEAIRCLKRYIARDVYNHLPGTQLALDSP
jgi:transposase